MNTEKTMTEVASKTVDSLSQAIGKIAPEAWEAMVRGTRIEATGDVILSCLMVLTLPVALWAAHALWKKEELSGVSEDPNSGFYLGAAITIAVFSFIMFAIGIGSLPKEVSTLMAPERAVILRIAESMR